MLLFHINLIAHRGPGLGPIATHGDFGVDLFFVLSGFVLSLVYAPNLPSRCTFRWYRTRITRRLAKIYPIHFLTLVIAILAISVVRHHRHDFFANDTNTVRSAISHLLLLHAFGLSRNPSWNILSWSVSAEWFAYSVLFAPIVFLLRRVRTLYVALLAAALWAGLLALCAFVLHQPFTLTNNGILRITPEFLCGYLLFRLLDRRTPSYGDAWTLFGIALTLSVCFLDSRFGWLLMPALLSLLTGLYFGGRATNVVFGNRLIVAIGEASYSIYMLQLFVVIVFIVLLHRAHVVPGTKGIFLVAIAFSAAACAVGYVVFRTVEEPLRQLILRTFGAKSRNPEADATNPPPGLASDTQTAATLG